MASPLIGYAAAKRTFELGKPRRCMRFCFLWQFPHFYAIAWMYRDDYGRAGIRMLPVVEPSNVSTARRIVWMSVALIQISVLPKYLAMAGNIFLFGALALGLYFVSAGRARRRATGRRRGPARFCWPALFTLPLLYGLLVFDGSPVLTCAKARAWRAWRWPLSVWCFCRRARVNRRCLRLG